MPRHVETFSPKGWSPKSLDYLLYLAEHPLANGREVCEAVGLSWRKGRTANEYRNKYTSWREVEGELKESPEACTIFLARMHMPTIAKAMIEQAKSGKNSVAAAGHIRDIIEKATGDGKPKGMPEWMESMLGTGQKPDNVVPLTGT